jgi:hypothetical protein
MLNARCRAAKVSPLKSLNNAGGAMYALGLHCSTPASSLARTDLAVATSRRSRLVRETSPRYEGEGSEQRTLGSVSIPPDAQWLATLTVPIPERQVVFLEVERRGPLPVGYRGGVESAHLTVPMSEVTALVALLTGVVADARYDGVLPSHRDGTYAE